MHPFMHLLAFVQVTAFIICTGIPGFMHRGEKCLVRAFPCLYKWYTVGMECTKPTKRNPNGRTGTWSGYYAHRNAGEPACPSCAEAARNYSRQAAKKRYYDKPEEQRIRSAKGRARRRKIRTLPYTAKQITDTFGAVCHLCEHEVDLQMEPGTPLSPVVDHIVPMRYEDGPGDQLSNVRWSHERCQIRRRRRNIGGSSLPFPKPRGDEF